MAVRRLLKKGPLGGLGKAAVKRVLREARGGGAGSGVGRPVAASDGWPAPQAPTVPTAATPAAPPPKPAPAPEASPKAASGAAEEAPKRRRGRLWVQVAKVTEVAPGVPVSVKALSEQVVLAFVEGNYYAITDRCPSDKGLLSSGTLEGFLLKSARTEISYDIRTGEPSSGEAGATRTWEVKAGSDGLVKVRAR